MKKYTLIDNNGAAIKVFNGDTILETAREYGFDNVLETEDVVNIATGLTAWARFHNDDGELIVIERINN